MTEGWRRDGGPIALRLKQRVEREVESKRVIALQLHLMASLERGEEKDGGRRRHNEGAMRHRFREVDGGRDKEVEVIQPFRNDGVKEKQEERVKNGRH